MNLWGEEIVPKQTGQKATQTQAPAQPQPEEMSANDMVNKSVTAASSANHIATRLNYCFEMAVTCYKRVNDLIKRFDFEENKRVQIAKQVDTLESKLNSFITAHEQDMKILRDGMTALMANELDLDEEQLSSPETESRIHGEID